MVWLQCECILDLRHSGREKLDGVTFLQGEDETYLVYKRSDGVDWMEQSAGDYTRDERGHPHTLAIDEQVQVVLSCELLQLFECELSIGGHLGGG